MIHFEDKILTGEQKSGINAIKLRENGKEDLIFFEND